MEEMEEKKAKKVMSKRWKFHLWLWFTLSAVAIHAAILTIVCVAIHNWNPTISKIVWHKTATTILPFSMSRWLDLLIWPVYFGVLIPLITSKRVRGKDWAPNLSNIIITCYLPFGLVLGLFFGLTWDLLVGLVLGLFTSLSCSAIWYNCRLEHLIKPVKSN
jgi:cell shape-determining protein MreD